MHTDENAIGIWRYLYASDFLSDFGELSRAVANAHFCGFWSLGGSSVFMVWRLRSLPPYSQN
jgi:hypothetical protein